jgi:hypothetical protein
MHDCARRRRLDIGIEALGDRAGTPGQHHALAQRFVQAVRQKGIGAAALHGGRQHQGISDDAALAAAGERELRGLGDVVAEDEMGLQPLPQAGCAQRLFGGAAIGRMLGIGDGEAADLPGLQRGADRLHPRLSPQRRAGGREQHDAADGIELTPVTRVAALGEAKDEGFVGGEEHLDRAALLDLAGDVAGGAEGEPHLLPGLRPELGCDLCQGELQVRGAGDQRRLRLALSLRGCGQWHGEQRGQGNSAKRGREARRHPFVIFCDG